MGVPDDEAGRAARQQGKLPGTRGGMKAELESLRDFKNRVDALLDDLDESDAAPRNLSGDQLTKGSMGANFTEADVLQRVYDQVHGQIAGFARLLSEQIGALSATVEGSRNNYESVDVRTQRRILATQQELEKHYDPKRDPNSSQYQQSSGDQSGQ